MYFKMRNVFFAILLCLNILRSSQGVEELEKQRMKFPFIKNASSFDDKGGYDYIIVGGGATACPLAATLSDKYSVLVLERGQVPYGNRNICRMENFHINLNDNSPSAPAQYFLSTDGISNIRPRVLGGGTSIGGGFYSRTSDLFIKRAGWDAKLVKKSYRWIENQLVQFRKLEKWQEVFKDALLQVGVTPYNGYTYNHFYGTKIGGSLFDGNGYRRTAADVLAAGNHQNLHVLVHATVQRIMFNTVGSKPEAIGVVFKDENGKQHQAMLSQNKKSEVILSAGAIGSPQLLLLSGVGPAKDLKQKNIDVVLDNKFVGKEIGDPPASFIYLPTKKPSKQSNIQAVAMTKKFFIETVSGFGHKNKSIIQPHYELPSTKIRVRGKKNLPYEVFNGGFVTVKVLFPESTGQITLNTTDVDDNPIVTFNYFDDPKDLKTCVEGMQIMEKIVRAKPFIDLSHNGEYTMETLLNMSLKHSLNVRPKHSNSTKSLEQYCNDNVATKWHYHGGCLAGKVIDVNYRVLGIHGLRVLDASVAYRSPGAPQATYMMFGRYMGAKILKERDGENLMQSPPPQIA